MDRSVFGGSGSNRVNRDARPSSRKTNTSASATLKAVWKSAAIRAPLGSSRAKRSAIGCMNGKHKHDADSTIDQIPDRQATACRVSRTATFQ